MDKVEAREQMGLNPALQTVLITGGSQGSAPINSHFTKQIDKYKSRNIQLIWQCGMRDYELIRSAIDGENIQLHKFISEMGLAYSAADVVVSRAGAIALAEIMICSKPAVLVPFPHAAGDHQMTNARAMVDRQAAKLVPQTDLAQGALEKVLFVLLDDPKELNLLSQNAGQMARPTATERIVEEVIALVA